MTGEQARARWVEIFAALASEPRLQIVELLSHGRVHCQEILGQIDLSQPAVSYHLGKLERAGVLAKERHGTRNCYQIREDVRGLFAALQKEDGTWITP